MAWTQTYFGEEPQRINKWLAQSGVCSRREADAFIAAGAVSIDGQTVTEAGRKIESGETLTLNSDATEKLAGAITLVMNKPVGYVSAHPNKGELPAARLAIKANCIEPIETYPTRDTRLAPIGRLDMDSRGLLILSEDGVLTKSVIGPDSIVEKEYLVKVTGKISDEKIQKLRHGLILDKRQLKPAIVTKEGQQQLRFILIEGRNRQIRRMCELVGLHVIDLFRIRIGPVKLQDIPEGKWRPLTEQERTSLLAKNTKRTPAATHADGAKTAPSTPRAQRRNPPIRSRKDHGSKAQSGR